MAITTIPWSDGSGDNIYVSAPSQTGTETVSVSSDANTGAARTQTVTFTAGAITRSLTVNQEAGAVLPAGYTQVQYVNMPGTSYLNMGIAGSEATDAVEIDLQLNAATEQMRIFCRHSTSNQSASGVYFQVYLNGSVQLGMRYKQAWHSSTLANVIDTNRHRLKVDYYTQTAEIDDETGTFSGSGTAGTSAGNTTIGGRYNSNPRLNAKVYGAKMWRSGSLIRNYIFCRDANNVAYAYDSVNDSITAFSGSGTTVGPDV